MKSQYFYVIEHTEDEPGEIGNRAVAARFAAMGISTEHALLDWRNSKRRELHDDPEAAYFDGGEEMTWLDARKTRLRLDFTLAADEEHGHIWIGEAVGSTMPQDEKMK